MVCRAAWLSVVGSRKPFASLTRTLSTVGGRGSIVALNAQVTDAVDDDIGILSLP